MRRRKFLAGIGGVSLGLPFLGSIATRELFAQAPSSPRRFIYFHQNNGIGHHFEDLGSGSDRERYRYWDNFFPRRYGALDGTAFESDLSLYPLRDYGSRMIIPRGLHTAPGGYRIAGHMHGNAKRLTAAPLYFNEFGNQSDENDSRMFAGGTSLDQEIARHFNPPGRGAFTLRVGKGRSGTQGVISYTGPNEPVTGESNPWRAYQAITGVSSTTSDEARARLIERRESVLDLVRDDLESVRRMDLGEADRRKLDMHLEATRALETRMDEAGLIPRELPPDRVAELEALDPDLVERNEMFEQVGELQMDVLALAIASGYTSTATLQWSVSAGQVRYQWDGMDFENAHHPISHGNTSNGSTGDPIDGWRDMLDQIDRWHAKQLKYLLDRLDAYEEPDGTVLDNSVVMWSNEIGANHTLWDVPHILVGSCGGYLRTGQHVAVTSVDPADLPYLRKGWCGRRDELPHDAPHNKLLTTILNAVGVREEDGSPVRMFGSNNGAAYDEQVGAEGTVPGCHDSIPFVVDDPRERVQPGELEALKT